MRNWENELLLAHASNSSLICKLLKVSKYKKQNNFEHILSPLHIHKKQVEQFFFFEKMDYNKKTTFKLHTFQMLNLKFIGYKGELKEDVAYF